MKKFLASILLTTASISLAQSSTPNIGLQIPTTGSNNWYIPLNYNFTKIDLLLSGNSPLPKLTVTGAVTVGGVITAAGFVGPGGSGSVLSSGAAQYSPVYFSAPGTGLILSGVTPFNGAAFYSTSAIPRAWLSSDVGTLLSGGATGCSTSGYVYSPPSNTCVPAGGSTGFSGATNLTGQISVFANGALQSVGSPFAAAINCTQCGTTYEAGYTGLTSVSGTPTYANPSVPTSASVTDGTHVVTLTTPFNSWTEAHTYTTNTTFTLTALGNGQTVNSSASIGFAYNTFGGVGTAGATGATASGTCNSTESAVLTGATGTLAGAGFNNQGNYGPFSPSNQKIYVIMFGGSHTFTSGGFAFPMNTPTAITYTNSCTSATGMYIYESTSTFVSGTFTLNLAS